MADGIRYDVGESFVHKARRCTIIRQVDVNDVMVEFSDTGATQVVPTVELAKEKTNQKTKSRIWHVLTPSQREEAERRFEIIKPIVKPEGRPPAKIKDVAERQLESERTIRRWVNAYKERGRLVDLAPDRPKRRATRLSNLVEAIITKVIDDFWLNKQKHTKKEVVKEVIKACRKAGLTPPSANTIRARINRLDQRKVTEKREGKKVARDLYGEIKGEFPGADFPLAVVQIDHTPLDLELVDDVSRLPIGRPWLTLAIDVYSRMVTGLYLSLEHPSAFSVGMCIRHSVLRKDAELEKLGVKGGWPAYGKMNKLHFDNGKDFRSATVGQACKYYDIDVDFRPVATPNFGGHIERLLKTTNDEFHEKPGTTFSNIIKKGSYKSDKEAIFTLNEARTHLLRFIVGDYHQRIHRSLHMSPIKKWNDGIMGTQTVKGRGLIPDIDEPDRFAIDFLPHKEATVQRNGIVWDHIHYMAPELRHWIKAKKGRETVKFIVRRDPRDISKIYFLDPELEEYLTIPYRDHWHESISLWELRAVRAELKRQGIEDVDEDLIFQTYDDMDKDIENAKKETRRVRRDNQRKKDIKESLAEERCDLSTDENPRGNHGPDEQQIDTDSLGMAFDLTEEELKPMWKD